MAKGGHGDRDWGCHWGSGGSGPTSDDGGPSAADSLSQTRGRRETTSSRSVSSTRLERLTPQPRHDDCRGRSGTETEEECKTGPIRKNRRLQDDVTHQHYGCRHRQKDGVGPRAHGCTSAKNLKFKRARARVNPQIVVRAPTSTAL